MRPGDNKNQEFDLEKLQVQRDLVKMLEEELLKERQKYNDLLLDYRIDYAKFRVGDRVRLVDDEEEWVVSHAAASGVSHRMFYTIKCRGTKLTATVLEQHLTLL